MQLMFKGEYSDPTSRVSKVWLRVRRRRTGLLPLIFALACLALNQSAFAFGGKLIAWGSNYYGESDVPANATSIVAVAAGVVFTFALTDQGSTMAWGHASEIPPQASGFVAITAGPCGSMGLRSDGTLRVWSPSPTVSAIPVSATNVVKMSVGNVHVMALTADGRVLAWGDNTWGESDVPAEAKQAVDIAAGGMHSMALKADGSVISWGQITRIPASATNVVRIGTTFDQCLALRQDGTVVQWAQDFDLTPPGLNDFVDISNGGAIQWVALRRNGTVSAWTWPGGPVVEPPSNLTNVTAIAACSEHSVALVDYSGLQFYTEPRSQSLAEGEPVMFSSEARGSMPIAYSWTFNGSSIPGASQRFLTLPDGQAKDQGSYVCVASNTTGSITSQPAILNMTPSSPRIRLADADFVGLPGSTASFTATVRGTRPLGLQWQHNGTNLLNATNATLNLEGLGWTDSGAYRLVATNSLGSTFSQPVSINMVQAAVWGSGFMFQTNVPPSATNLVAIAAGGSHLLALHEDGTVLAWGGFDPGVNAVPPDVTNAIALSGAENFSTALLQNGRVRVWGDNTSGQTNVPSELTNAVAVSAGDRYCLALRQDGTVIAWGHSEYASATIPSTAKNIVKIAAGSGHNLALRDDGTIIAWGRNGDSQATVPPGATNINMIAAGWTHSLALSSEGSVIAWGNNSSGQCNVPAAATNIVAISANGNSSIALRQDGQIIGWGDNSYDRTATPPLVTNVNAVAAGGTFNAALVDQGVPRFYQPVAIQTSLAGDDLILIAGVFAKPSFIFQWLFNSVPILGATNAWLSLHDTQQQFVGDYSLVVSGGSTVLTGRVAAVTVTPRTPIIRQQPGDRLALPRGETTFAVLAVGTGPLNYQWRFNDADLPNATNSTLNLSPLQLANDGLYQVIVSNPLGAVTSAVARLEIFPFNRLMGFTNVAGSWTGEWGDYDNDGRLDLLVGGKAGGQPVPATVRLFHNEGDGRFTQQSQNFQQAAQSMAWGDFDNDGWLDILLLSANSARIWRNNGVGTFTDVGLALTADYSTVASLIDFNGDGLLDISLGGRLYRNLGGNAFINVSGGLPVTQYSTTAWGDYDRDGRPDLLICGLVNGSAQFRLYRNLGNGTFTNVPAAFPDVYRGQGAWLDFDNDGRLDVLMSGQISSGGRFTSLYRNHADGTFTPVESALPALSYASLAIADCDNDGQSDVFLSGYNGTNYLGALYRGFTNGQFAPIASPFPTNIAPSAAWGDYDADGRMDLALSTMVSGQPNVVLYRNDASAINSPPSPPGSAASGAGVNSITFAWSSGADAQTPAAALTYGLRVGRFSGGTDVLSPDGATNGTRRLSRMGNAGQARSLTLTNLPFGRYYWAVQSVDSAFAGSQFLPERLFVYAAATFPVTNIASSQATLNGMLDTNALPALAWFEWGTTTNHGGLTPIQSVSSNSTIRFLEAAIAGLQPGTAYYHRLVVSNAIGLHYGGEQTFTTTDLPAIVPLAANSITASNATLNGLVNPNGALTRVSFDYGLTEDYGSSTLFTNIGASHGLIALSKKVGGLIGGQVYHFRIVATNSAGILYSADQTFATTLEPEATTVAASSIGATSATLNGLVRPNTLATSVFFEYGANTNLGSTTAALNLPGSTNLNQIAIRIEGLSRLTTYYFRVAASNIAGLTRGSVFGFRTTNDVMVLPPTDITMAGARLNALVNPNGLQTSVVFEYGLTSDFGNITPVIGLNGGTNLMPVSWPLTGLLSNRTYHVRVVATNLDGSRSSTELNFQTLPVFSVVDLGLTGVAGGFVAWGDYDNDGKLDLLAANQTLTRLYRNLGGGSFAPVSTSIIGTTSGSVAWGDFNNDGWLDVLVVGTSSTGPSSRIYRNNGNGTFSDIQAALQPVGLGVGRWGDFNNDGRQDVLLVGESNEQPFSKIFQNRGDGDFVEISVSLPAYLDAHAVTLDYDNDGRLDVLLMGRVGTPFADVYAKLYRNAGEGSFVDSGIELPGVRLGFGEWGDFDGDGWPDLLYGGSGTGLWPVLYLFRNQGDGTFSNLSALVPQFAPDAVHWGDYDNDGQPDILARGQQVYSSIVPSNSYSAFLHNNGTNALTYTYLPLPEIWSSSGGVYDYDDDGRLDFVNSGNSRTGSMLRFYRNNCSTTNTPPTAPGQLACTVSSNALQFGWTRGTDAQSPSMSLTYNVRVGSAPGSGDVVSSLSGSNGLLQVVAPGNAGEATTLLLTNLPAGTYYWSVQSVDAAFASSPFTGDQMVVVPGVPQVSTLGPTNVTSRTAVLLASVIANGSATLSHFEWGSTTNLGHLTEWRLLPADFTTNQVSTLLTNLASSDTYYYRVVASNALGVVYGMERQVQTVYPPLLNSIRLAGNLLQINFTGSLGAAYDVYTSTNLVNWIHQGQAYSIGSNSFRFVDPLSTSDRVRFYRVASP
jgi:alpha-tubulin suppressor-like RCC1 family protein